VLLAVLVVPLAATPATPAEAAGSPQIMTFLRFFLNHYPTYDFPTNLDSEFIIEIAGYQQTAKEWYNLANDLHEEAYGHIFARQFAQCIEKATAADVIYHKLWTVKPI
jgi:hypothetical protein